MSGPTGLLATYAYDGLGRIASTKDGRGSLTSYAYDNAGHLVTLPAADSTKRTMTYDKNGNLATLTDARGIKTTYGYDAADRVTSVKRDTQTWKFTYDSDGRRRTVVAPSGRTTTLTWDRRSLLTKVDYSDSTPDVTYAYDAAGRRVSMTDGTGTTTYTYDALSRLTSAKHGTDAWAYTWDGAGRMTSRTAPGQSAVTYAYDAGGRLTKAVLGTTVLAAYSYDTKASTMTRVQGNGVTTVQTHDRNAMLAKVVETAKSGAVLSSATYVRDLAGNPTQVTDQAGKVTTFEYDTRNRLVAACYGTKTCQGATDFVRYTYDANGNLTSQARAAGATSYTYGAADQLVSQSGVAGARTFGYDADGNRTSDGTATFVPNAAGQVTSTTVGGVTTTSTFTGSGQPATSTTGGATTTFDYDPLSAQLVGERSGKAVTRAYVYGRELVGMVAGSATTYLSTDELGSVTASRDASGAIGRTMTYEPYGALRAKTAVAGAPAVPVMFAGGYSPDAGGTYRFGVRTYSPATGSFATPDQGGSGAPYRYASGNPLVLTDPLGLYSWSNFVQDVNEISGWVAVAGQVVAIGCTALVVCAPVAPFAEGLSLVGSAVNAASGAAVAADTCTTGKGSCEGAIAIAAIGMIGAKFGGGRLLGAAEAGGDTVSLFKASQRGLGDSHYANGYKAADFPGNGAYFAKDSSAIADSYATHYGEGVIETRVPRSVYDEHFAEHEMPYLGTPSGTELAIPPGKLDFLSQFDRIWHR